MTGPQQRGRDPQPLSRGGEVALIALAAALLLLALAALLGLGVAAALLGGGWVWPAGSQQTGPVLRGLLTGRPGTGLPPPVAARVPGPAGVYGCVAATELLTVGFGVAAVVLGWRYHRPRDARRGMATRGEAAQVLGWSRLHAARAILRPDLTGPRAPDAGSRGAVRGGAW